MPILTTWNRLHTGLVAVAAIVLAGIGILVYGRVGTLHGGTVQLHVAMGNSLGLIRGSDVWLDGQKVGTVDAVALRAPSADSDRTVLTITVLSSALSHFRSNTRASIKSGGSLLGTPVLFALSGTMDGRPLRPSDTLIVASDQPSATVQVESTMHKIPTVIAGFGGVAHDVSWIARRAAGGGRGREITQQLQGLQTATGRLSERVAAARLTDPVLGQRVNRALAHADSLRQLLQGGAPALQRVRRDTALTSALTAARQDLLHLQQIVASREGTVARMAGDSSVDHQLREAVLQVNQLIADVHKHPLRYIAF